MSSRKLRKRQKSVRCPESDGWDGAIRDARRHIERLRAAIAVCEERKAAGDAWPGSLPDVRLQTATRD
jgi:hypothetical protein